MSLNPKYFELNTYSRFLIVGDHQQLQPSTAVYTLARDFQMQVSLFERLLTNGLPYVRLQEQHRMRDQFLHLLVPTIYEDYFSHCSVFEYDHIRGMLSLPLVCLECIKVSHAEQSAMCV